MDIEEITGVRDEVLAVTSEIYCALDGEECARMLQLGNLIKNEVDGFKLGLEFFYACGREGYATIARLGRPIFLDLKIHDIPNTASRALVALLDLEPHFITIHMLGGTSMAKACVHALKEYKSFHPFCATKILGITILTSLEQEDLIHLGFAKNVHEETLSLAHQANEACCDGIVCSPQDLQGMDREFRDRFTLVVPGIRPEGFEHYDQKRFLKPTQAQKAGANILVIGRPITEAANPLSVLQSIRHGLLNSCKAGA